MADKETILTDGHNLINQGKYKEAQKIYEQALNDNPKDIDFLYNLAYVAFIKEDRKLAMDNLSDILKYSPLYHQAYYLKARINYHFNEDMDQTVEFILKAIELNPENSYYYSLASSLIFYAMNNDKRATKMARDALEYDETNYEAHLVLASRFQKKQNEEKAIEHYKIALEHGPKQEGTYYYLNLLHIEFAKTKAGLKLIKDEAAKYPDFEPYQWLLKFSYMRNQPFNLPFVFIEDLNLPINMIIGLVVFILVLIAIMYSSDSISITLMTIFKWLCSIVFILYIPYQLLIYIVLNAYYHFLVKPAIFKQPV